MKALLILLVLGKGADVGTTVTVLKHGGHEQNWLLSQQPAVMTLQQVGWTTGEVLVIRKLAVRHPKLAKGAAWLSIAGSLYASGHNLRELQR
jgi:hypothetical protein